MIPIFGLSGAAPLFQSSPGQKAGCNGAIAAVSVVTVRVSILTRPEGRMQSAVQDWASPVGSAFQSSPGQKAGCNYPPAYGHNVGGLLFQSSPGQKAGCNQR